MKHSFSMLLVCGLLGCGVAQHGMPQAISKKSFPPLMANEIITSSYKRTGAIIELSLYRTDRKLHKSSLLFKISRVEPVEATVAAEGRKGFFIVHSEDPNGFDDLWLVDGNQGKAYPLIKASPAFAVSADGNYVCFDDLKFQIGNDSDYPSVSVYDVKADKNVKRYDFVEKGFSGAGPNISYDVKKNRFHVEFTVEDRTVGIRDIELP